MRRKANKTSASTFHKEPPDGAGILPANNKLAKHAKVKEFLFANLIFGAGQRH